MQRIYGELASWWPLLSATEDYAEEAACYAEVLERTARRPVRTVLELGAGGGNNAWHLRRRFRMVLTDASEEMLAVSRAQNPDCEHVQGDMRTLRLGRRFDAVFAHDAIAYMADEGALRAALRTAGEHLEPGGVALFAPDATRERFRPGTSHGGHDGAGRALRYLEWIHDDDPDDGRCEVDYALLCGEAGAPPRVVHERHVLGLFARADWLRWIGEAGLEALAVPRRHAPFLDEDPAGRPPAELFLGRRAAAG